MRIVKQSTSVAAEAAALLKKGEVIICPTDTIYGFLADASNKKAIEKIYKIKRRSKSKPLSVFVKDLKMAKDLAEIEEKHVKMLRKFWPGKYTFILKRKYTLNLEASKFRVYGVNKEKIAIRIPKHPFLQKLLKKINKPLAQTSANISTQEPLYSVEQIIATFGKNRLVGLIVDGGEAKGGKPSKITDLTARHLTRLR